MSHNSPAVDKSEEDKGYLLKRKDYKKDKDAQSHPNRTYFFKSHDIEQLIETCTRKLQTDPLNAKALFLRGSSYLKKGLYDAAARDFSSALQSDPGHVECLFSRGVVLSRLGYPLDAIKDFTEALRLNPDHANAAFARAACYNTVGKFSEAITDYNWALSKDSNNVERNGERRERRRSSTFDKPSNMTSSSGVMYTQPTSSAFLLDSNYSSNIKDDEDDEYENINAVKDSEVDSNMNGNSALLQAAGRPTSYTPRKLETNPKLRRSISGMSHDGSVMSAVSAEASAANRSPPALFSPMRRVELERGRSASVSSTASADYPIPESTFAASASYVKPLKKVAANRPAPVAGQQDVVVMPAELQLSELHHTNGYQLRKEGDFKAAIAEYSKAIEINPNHFKAIFNRGFAHDKLNCYQEAIQDYGRALLIEPNNAFAYYNRGISHDRMGMYDLACDDFTEAIQFQPNNADFHHNRAFCLRKLGRLEDAIFDYTESLRINPTHFKALHNRAYCLERCGHFEQACEDYTSALQQQPSHTTSLSARGSVYEKLGNFPEAIADLSKALDNLPEADCSLNESNGDFGLSQQRIPLLLSRAKLYEKVGRTESSISDYTLVINSQEVYSHHMRTSPRHVAQSTNSNTGMLEKDPTVFYARGMCHKSLKRFNEAIRDLTTMLIYYTNTINNENQQVLVKSNDPQQKHFALVLLGYLHRGYCWRKLEEYAKSIEDYTHAIGISPDSVRVYINRAYCLAKLNRFEEAIFDYTVVIKLDTNNSHAYHNRGISYDKLGQYDLAIADFTMVLELDSAIPTPAEPPMGGGIARGPVSIDVRPAPSAPPSVNRQTIIPPPSPDHNMMPSPRQMGQLEQSHGMPKLSKFQFPSPPIRPVSTATSSVTDSSTHTQQHPAIQQQQPGLPRDAKGYIPRKFSR